MTSSRSHPIRRPSAEQLLGYDKGDTEMSELQPQRSEDAKDASQLVEERYTDDGDQGRAPPAAASVEEVGNPIAPVEYKVYKRRWFGLMQLVLLNIIVSWDWLTYSPIANTTATFFATTSTTVNWLSTAFLFAFLVASPFTLYVLSTSGPRLAILAASVLILLGNWLRYAGTRTSPPSFALVMAGQIVIGLAQPFVLAAPTRYSDLWFTPQGRVSATAIMSLANPLGGALGQLISPFLANTPADVPNVTLYIAIISSVATIPSFFVPAKPPTPVAPSSARAKPSIAEQLGTLMRYPTFWLIFIPFSTYVGFFNSFSSLLTQILTPYGFSETESGIAGALLILVGLATAAVTSPIVDRSKRYLLLIKTLAPIIALAYLVFIWAPPSGSVVAPYLICAILGAASFSLVPVALEWLVEVSYPVGPEFSSTICWVGGQALGGLFIIISDALQEGQFADPPYNLKRALIFQAVCALAVMPSAMVLGVLGGKVVNRRLELDKGTITTRDEAAVQP